MLLDVVVRCLDALPTPSVDRDFGDVVPSVSFAAVLTAAALAVVVFCACYSWGQSARDEDARPNALPSANLDEAHATTRVRRLADGGHDGDVGDSSLSCGVELIEHVYVKHPTSYFHQQYTFSAPSQFSSGLSPVFFALARDVRDDE